MTAAPVQPAMLAAAVDRDGFAVTDALLSPSEAESLREAFVRVAEQAGRARAGIRGIASADPAFEEFVKSTHVRRLLACTLGKSAFLVRSIGFDKTPDANWDVVWHQDVTIAVRERIDFDGYGPWSTKAGVTHVQPPATVLEQMLTLRFHLDDCGQENGALKCVPGSHRIGIIDVRTLDASRCESDAVDCVARAGACVLVKPLTLHASKKALIPGHRRVLHLEFACQPLPGGLCWHVE